MTENPDEPELRKRYLAAREREAWAQAEAAASAAKEAGELESALRSARSAAGGDAAELERFFEYSRLRAEYRRAALAASASADWGEGPVMRRRLKEFCLTDGRDLEELQAFFRGVDADTAEIMPQ